MIWRLSHGYDPIGAQLADRHYNRRKISSPQFVPPGRRVVLISECGRAVWVISWPFAEYTRHAWAGAWVNSLFRNEGAGLSSELIRQAVAVTRSVWEPPPLGMITFVDSRKVRSTNPGACYQRAGFHRVGLTTRKEKLIAWQLLPDEMPPAEVPRS